jgi:hypothetical protein
MLAGLLFVLYDQDSLEALCVRLKIPILLSDAFLPMSH